MPPLNTNHIVMIMRTIIVMMIMTIMIMMIMPFAKLTMSTKSGAARSKSASKIDLKAEQDPG